MRVIVDRLSKTYRDRSGQELAALEDIALRVEPEEFVAVLGPSGCGKSTLLGIMAGLLPSTAGEVFFEDERRDGQPLTATVFQEFALFPWRTVRGNVGFGLEELGAVPAERKERVARFIAMTGLVTDIERQMQWWTQNGFMKRTIPLRGIVDTSFVEEAAKAVPEK